MVEYFCFYFSHTFILFSINEKCSQLHIEISKVQKKKKERGMRVGEQWLASWLVSASHYEPRVSGGGGWKGEVINQEAPCSSPRSILFKIRPTGPS